MKTLLVFISMLSFVACADLTGPSSKANGSANANSAGGDPCAKPRDKWGSIILTWRDTLTGKVIEADTIRFLLPRPGCAADTVAHKP